MKNNLNSFITDWLGSAWFLNAIWQNYIIYSCQQDTQTRMHTPHPYICKIGFVKVQQLHEPALTAFCDLETITKPHQQCCYQSNTMLQETWRWDQKSFVKRLNTQLYPKPYIKVVMDVDWILYQQYRVQAWLQNNQESMR